MNDPGRFVFEDQGGSLGRAVSNDLTLPDPERFISSHHAHITFRDGVFALVDTSVNGVFVNGSNEAIGKNNTATLSNGDCITIGAYALQVSIDKTNDSADFVRSGSNAESALTATPRSPWDSVRTPKESLGLLLGSEPYAKTPDVFGWDQDVVDDGSQELPSSLRSASESDHSPFGQQHYTPPIMKPADDAPSWDRTDISFPLVSERDDLELDAEVDSKCVEELVSSGDSDNVVKEDKKDALELIPRSSVGEFSTPEQIIAKPEDQHLDELDSGSDLSSPISLRANESTDSGTSSNGVPATGVGGLDGGVDAVQAFLGAAGLNEIQVLPEEVLALMEMLGGLYRETVQGTMDVLRARSELKNEFRMRHTQIRIAENNPLKFSVSIDEALEHLVFHRNESFLPPDTAFMEAFQDIKDHQIAMVAGMKSTFDSILRRLDPELLTQCVVNEKKIGHRLPLNRKAGCWEHYEKLYGELSAAAEDDFLGLFGEEFTRAYEEQVARLSLLRRKPPG